MKKKEEESDSDEEDDEYSPRRDENGNPFYGPVYPSYMECEDAMDRALGEQDYLNPFRDVCVWKKLVGFLGALPVSLTNNDWTPNYSGGNLKVKGDRKWHVNVKIVDPFGNTFERGYETKKTGRKVSGEYKLSDVMSPGYFRA